MDAFFKGLSVNGVTGIVYTGPSGKYTLTAAQRSLAVSLKNALDAYNNISCPIVYVSPSTQLAQRLQTGEAKASSGNAVLSFFRDLWMALIEPQGSATISLRVGRGF